MKTVTAEMVVDVPARGAAASGVVLGCPFERGAVLDATSLTLRGPEGDRPFSFEPLSHWPGDEGVRWARLVFLAQSPGVYQLVEDQLDASSRQQDGAVWIKQTKTQVQLGNGRLMVTLSRSGSGPIQSITLDNHVVFAGPDRLTFHVNEASSDLGTVTHLEILEQSPMRGRVRVHGEHRTQAGDMCLTYQLDVELWAGMETLRMDYQYFHVQPGARDMAIQSMRAVFKPESGDQMHHHFHQRHHGLRMRPRGVSTPRRIEIIGDYSRNVPYVATRDMLQDTQDYPPYLLAALAQTSPWIGLWGPEGGVHVHLADMVNHRPKKLIGDAGQIIVELWPQEAGPMLLPQGRSRRHTFTLAFSAPGTPLPEPSAVEKSLQLPIHEGKATLAPWVARQAQVFDQAHTLAPGSHIRIEQFLAKMMQAVVPSKGEFDYGDIPEAGYFRNYVAAGRQPLRPSADNQENTLSPNCTDAIFPIDPSRYEPVWANNEYDIIHALCTELMRTGLRKHWPVLHAMVRHNIEVDFIAHSDDPWQHHGSPAHSANHNNASAYPSHLWTQGLLEYYCLTGDDDAKQVAIKLGDTIIRNLEHPERRQDLWGFNREIGWALLALVQLHETTALPRFTKAAQEIIDYLIAYNRDAQASPVKLSNVDALDEIHRQVVGAFFGYASMVEAMDRFARLENREDIKQWLREFLGKVREAAHEMLHTGRTFEPVRHMLLLGMAIGYELTSDRAFLQTGMLGLEMFIDTPAWTQSNGQVKTTAMLHRSLTRFLTHAHHEKLLLKIDYRFAELACENES